MGVTLFRLLDGVREIGFHRFSSFMALIECYECGKEISSLAHSCPACGAPKKHTKKKKATKRNASSVELTDRQREQIESIEATSVKKKTVKKRAAKTQRSDKLDSKKYRGDIAPNVSKSAVSKVKKKTSQKHQTKKSVSKVNKIEDSYVKSKTPPKSQWP